MALTDLVTEEAPSPFLPNSNIQYAWDSTSLEDFKRCPRLYQYRMIDGWVSEEESVHLRFGRELHQSLHDYELSISAGIPHDDAVFDVVKELLLRTDDWRPDHKYKNRKNLVRTVVWYLDKFKNDPAQTMVKDDGKPIVEYSFRFELDWGPTAGQPYVLCGHLDRVVNFHDELFVMDHKTTTTEPSDYYWNQFNPHNQMSLYTLASKIVFESNIKGVIINAAEVKIGFSRFTRGTTYRTKDQLEEWLHDLKYWLNLAEGYAEAGYWPMNDTACDKYGGCPFREICSKSPSVRDKFLNSSFVKREPWNPLQPR